MQFHTKCPSCEGRIGIAAGIRAPTPFRFRCPHCRREIRVRFPGMWILFLALLAAGCAFAVWIARTIIENDYARVARDAMIAVGVWLLLEILFCGVFYTHAKLEVDPPPALPHDEPDVGNE